MAKASVAKEKGGLRVLLYGLLLFIAGIALWQSLENKMSDITAVSSKLNDKVNATLLRSGFSDADITSQLSRENKNNSLKWVSFEKEITVPKSVNFALLKESIADIAKQYDFTVHWENLDNSQKAIIQKQNNSIVSLKFNFVKEVKTQVQKTKKKSKAHKK